MIAETVPIRTVRDLFRRTLFALPSRWLPPDMRNADDSIYGEGGSRSLLDLRTAGKGYVGSISMGVRRS